MTSAGEARAQVASVLVTPRTRCSPVEVLRAAHGHEAVGVGQFGEAADLVVFLKRRSDGHDDVGGAGGGLASGPGTTPHVLEEDK